MIKGPSQNEKVFHFQPFSFINGKSWNACPSCISGRCSLAECFRYAVWHVSTGEQKNFRSAMKQKKAPGLGPEAPGWKHLILVLVAVAVLIGLSWIAWFKFGWFHS